VKTKDVKAGLQA